MSQAFIIWFTGLSGSGKSTMANVCKLNLEDDGYKVLIIDGDDVRNKLHVHLGFTENDIKVNNILIVQLCQKYSSQYDVILVPIISPYLNSRLFARSQFKSRFYEIYFSADLEVVSQRDVKGLYAKVQEGVISNMIGVSPSNVYEPPTNPDLEIDSGQESVEQSSNKLYEFIVGKILEVYHQSAKS